MVLKTVVDARPPSTAEQLTKAIEDLANEKITPLDQYKAWLTIGNYTGADIEEIDEDGEQCIVWDDGSFIILTPPEEADEADQED